MSFAFKLVTVDDVAFKKYACFHVILSVDFT